VVLTHAPALLEPDDYAYRASIVALSQGHILLTNSQYHALARYLSAHHEAGILQWHHLTSGKWISEKNPGYPFFAVLFYWAHALRWAPLFYGALGCVGLYFGARAWLGRFAGTYAVWLYCFSGAALVFAWRSTMPSFSDASLIAAGAGGLVWTFVRTEHSRRARALVGLASFLCLEGATFIRYTNVLELGVAVLATALFARRVRIAWRTLALWAVSVVVFAVGVLLFNHWAYGSATSTGYSAGEISFSWSSFWPNLRLMPAHLTSSMPLWIVAALGLVALIVRALRHRGEAGASRDLAVALVLGAGWLGLWVLYLCYTWTASMAQGGAGVTVHVIRFYLPALGCLALLGAAALKRVHPGVAGGVIAVLVVASLFSFHQMAGSGGGFGGGFGGGGPGGFGGPSGRGGAGFSGRPPSGAYGRPGHFPGKNQRFPTPPSGSAPSGAPF